MKGSALSQQDYNRNHSNTSTEVHFVLNKLSGLIAWHRKTTLFHLQISVFSWFFEEHQTQFSELITKLRNYNHFFPPINHL